ncbi:MAG: hypothetical protein ACRELE_07050, partial [Gemmatimonadales bacterium]
MRHQSLSLLTLSIAACAAPRPPAPTVTLAATADTVIVPVVALAQAAPRSGGTWTVLALLEDQLYLADFASGSVQPFPGITKTEVPHPITLIGLGDTIVVGDWGLRRFTEWSPTGQRLAAWPAPDSLQGALPRARDAAGQWYFELWPDPQPDGSGLIDSGAVVRTDPQLTRFDTLARLAPPELVKMAGVNGQHYQRRSMGGEDAWGVLPDGTLWIARVFQNQIEWHHPGVKRVERSPKLPDMVLMVSDMDREIYVRRFPEDQRQTAREVPNAPVKPPFEHVFTAPDGRLWLAKSDTALARLRHFQVVDKTGVLLNIAVPTYGFALGVDRDYILMGEEFPGGIRLLRFPVPQ